MRNLRIVQMLVLIFAYKILNLNINNAEYIDIEGKSEFPQLNKEKIELCKNLVMMAIQNETVKIKEIEEKYSATGKLLIKWTFFSRINKCYRQIALSKLKKVKNKLVQR